MAAGLITSWRQIAGFVEAFWQADYHGDRFPHGGQDPGRNTVGIGACAPVLQVSQDDGLPLFFNCSMIAVCSTSLSIPP